MTIATLPITTELLPDHTAAEIESAIWLRRPRDRHETQSRKCRQNIPHPHLRHRRSGPRPRT